MVVNTQHKDKFNGETNLVGFTCSCERKGGGAFSGAQKVVVNTQHKDKFSGIHVLMGENKCPTQGERIGAAPDAALLPRLPRGGPIEEQLI